MQSPLDHQGSPQTGFLNENSESFGGKGDKTELPGSQRLKGIRVDSVVFWVSGERKWTCSCRTVFLALHSWSGLFVDLEMRVVE